MREIEGRFDRAERYELFTGHRSERNLSLYRGLGYRPFAGEQVNDHLILILMEKRREEDGH